MKTTFACVAIIILAIVFGRSQGARIKILENTRLSSRTAGSVMESRRAEREDNSGYRTKYARRDKDARADEVFERLLALKPGSGGSEMGPGAALQHREAMEAILQLDLKGVGELMALVYQSKELAKRWPMQPVAATLCFIAMTERSPQAAFIHLTESKEWNRLFTPDHIQDDSMVSYVLARMAEDSPQLAIDAMEKLKNSHKALKEESMRTFLSQIVRRDPSSALNVIAELPDADRERSYQMISYGMESDDERTALFLAARERFNTRPAEIEEVLRSFSSRFNDADRPVAETKEWLESLNMTEAEKQIVVEVGAHFSGDFNPDPVTRARWIAEFLRPSKERDRLIFGTLEPLMQADPPGISAIMRELGVEP